MLYLSVLTILYYNNIYFQHKLTPLHIAAYRGHVSVVQCLITSEADVKTVDNVSLKESTTLSQESMCDFVFELCCVVNFVFSIINYIRS